VKTVPVRSSITTYQGRKADEYFSTTQNLF
jgi:hypothetical protein